MLPRPLRGGRWPRLARRHTADIDSPGDLRIANANSPTGRLHILDTDRFRFDPLQVDRDWFSRLGIVRADGFDDLLRRS